MAKRATGGVEVGEVRGRALLERVLQCAPGGLAPGSGEARDAVFTLRLIKSRLFLSD